MFSLLVFTSCSSNLNNRIYDAQLIALERTPYYEPTAHYEYIELQRQYRERHLPKELYGLLNHATPTDTIILVEIYDEIVVGLAERMKVFYSDTVYSWDCLTNANFKKTPFVPDSTNQKYLANVSEFLLVKKKTIQGKSWNAEPLKYGAKECMDGSHTIITVITPEIHITSMYVRCWIADRVLLMLD